MNILVVDRNDMFPDLLRKVLVEDKKWNIITCSSGLVTLQLIEKFTPDMLIMDLNLPDIDSFEMLNMLNNLGQDIYTLVLIDKLEYGKLEQALLVGIDDYVVKPIEQKEMIARIKKAIWSSSRKSAVTGRDTHTTKPWQSLDEEMPGVNHIIIYPNTASKRQEPRAADAETGLANDGDTSSQKTPCAVAAEITPDPVRPIKKINLPKSASTYSFGLVKPGSLNRAEIEQNEVSDARSEIADSTRYAINDLPVKSASAYSFSRPENPGSEAPPAEVEPERYSRFFPKEEVVDSLQQVKLPVWDKLNTRLSADSDSGGTSAGADRAGFIPFPKEAAVISAEVKPAFNWYGESGSAPEREQSYIFGKPEKSYRKDEPVEPEPVRPAPSYLQTENADSFEPGELTAQEMLKPWKSGDRVTGGTAVVGNENTGFTPAKKEGAAFAAELKPGENRYRESGLPAEREPAYSFGLKQAESSSQAEAWPAVSKSRINTGSPLGRKERKKKQSAVVRVLGNICFAGLLVLMVTLAFFLVQSRMAGGPPSVFGYQMYVVLSGSMNPAFNTGSLAFIRPVEPERVQAGDIITFKSSSGGSTLTTHRVVEVDGKDGLNFVTRGDANRVNDPNPVPAENLVGKVYGAIPYLGYLLGFAQTKNGLLFLVVVPGLLLIANELRNLFRYAVENRKKKEMQNAGDLYTGRAVDHQ